MAKNKFYYYVIVQSEGQAKFVTKINNATKTALWKRTASLYLLQNPMRKTLHFV